MINNEVDEEDYDEADNYTPDEIQWRGTTYAEHQCICYVAGLGFKTGYGAMVMLEVDQMRGDGKWYASIEGGRKFGLTMPFDTAEIAQQAAMALAKQVLVELGRELTALSRNTRKQARLTKKYKSIGTQ